MFSPASYRIGSKAFSIVRTYITPNSRHAQWLIVSSTFTGLSLYALSQPIHNDASSAESTSISKRHWENVGQSPLVWGSNLNHLISPERDSNECIQAPTYAPELFSSPLKDLAFSHSHAACVDAGGNVYQWGDSFFGPEHTGNRRPRLTLQGKNIVSIAMTPTKIFALSASGHVYVLSSSLARQIAPLRPQSMWNIFGSSVSQPLYAILDTDVPLGWGEKFTSICAGSDHLLALTSLGRTFTHPVTRFANYYGQLGLRKISIQDPMDSSKRLSLDLSPKITRDSLFKENMQVPGIYRSEAEPSKPIDDKTAGFCGRLFEMPALRGVDVQQIAAGDHTSFVVTRPEGRVLGWGANGFGQLGLGMNITLPSVSVPTEIVLNKFAQRGSTSRCLSVAAGGDLTIFTVENVVATKESGIIDVLACGNGQWGGLGNSSYSNAQGVPVKVKTISGVLECLSLNAPLPHILISLRADEETTNTLKALRPHHISVAPGSSTTNAGMPPSSSGHIIATLDTVPLSHPSPTSATAAGVMDLPGRDVFSWGLNQHYQLGNGKRSSVSTPMAVETGDHEGRLMCKVSREMVKDFEGSVMGRKVKIEQRAVAGPSLSVVYWIIV